jgi:prevent-host-death family protein
MTANTMAALDARVHFGEILDRVRYAAQRFIVERKGKAVAAIVSMEDLRRLEALEYERDSELLRLARETSGGVVPFAIVAERFEAAYDEPLGVTASDAL